METSLCSLCLSAPAGSEQLLEITVDARHSYFTFSLAVKKDEVITVLEWQLKPVEGKPVLLLTQQLQPGGQADRKCKMYADMSFTLRL